jgi:hypothetical protein
MDWLGDFIEFLMQSHTPSIDLNLFLKSHKIQTSSRPTKGMNSWTRSDELASLFRSAHSQNAWVEMTSADVHSIIGRISANAADDGRTITPLPPLWKELEPAIDKKVNMNPQ